MGSNNPKTSYIQKYYFFVKLYHKEHIFRSYPPPQPSKWEIFQPLDRQCRLDSIEKRPYPRNMTFTT